jgi:hypothetical protein
MDLAAKADRVWTMHIHEMFHQQKPASVPVAKVQGGRP